MTEHPTQILTLDDLRADIRRQAKALGSQKKLADKCGVSSAFMSAVVLGHRSPGRKVLEVLGYSAEVIYRPIQSEKNNAKI